MPVTPEALVSALYRRGLLRDPDTHGLALHRDALENGTIGVDQLLDVLFRSDEFKRNLPYFVEHYELTRDRFVNDHSQHGEVFELIRLIVNAACPRGMIVDVGAHGSGRSNSYDFLKHLGWRGLLVEANPQLIETIQLEFGGLTVSIVNCAVSDFDGEGQLWLGVNSAISSLDERNVRNWGPVAGCLPVRVRRLGEILREHAVPEDFDILSLDIEGEDIKVMNDLVASTPYRPRWVVIEASHKFGVSSLDEAQFADQVKQCYRLSGQTVANLILRHEPRQCR
jgi:FkbM family methyltransferase